MRYHLIVLIFIKIIPLIERFGSQFYLRKHIHSLTIRDENNSKNKIEYLHDWFFIIIIFRNIPVLKGKLSTETAVQYLSTNWK